MDVHGARIMEDLKKRAGSDHLDFFGIGGPKMAKEGLKDNLANVNKLPDKPLYVFKNANQWHRERLYVPYMASTRFRNWLVIREMEKKFYDRLFQSDTAAVIALGNEYFMKRLYLGAAKQFEKTSHMLQMKPGMFYYDKLMYGQNVEHEYYLDHYFYTTPFRPANRQRYTAPSTFTGIQAIYDVYEFLYKQNDKYKGYVDQKGIFLNQEFNSIVMEELILQSRAQWREKHNVQESATLFFVSPGSDEKEMAFSIPLVTKAVNEFLIKFSKVSAANFAVVISFPEGDLF